MRIFSALYSEPHPTAQFWLDANIISKLILVRSVTPEKHIKLALHPNFMKLGIHVLDLSLIHI